jgi:hypothetical protein
METFANLFAEYWGVLLAFVLGVAATIGVQGGLFKTKEPIPEPVEHPENPPYANTPPPLNPRSPYTDIS